MPPCATAPPLNTGPAVAVYQFANPHRFGDILQGLRTQILKRYIYLAPNLPTCVVRNADTARFCDPFETHCNIDPVTKDIVIFDNNIADVNNARMWVKPPGPP